MWILALLIGFVALGYGFFGLDKLLKRKEK